MGDGSGLHPSAAAKQSEELKMPASSALPKTTANANASVDSTETAGGNIPSCYAPLPLKIGIARQGGAHSNNLVKQHSVAPSKGLNSGDTKEARHTQQRNPKVDKPSKRPASPSGAQTGSGEQATTSQDQVCQLEDQDKLVYKKRRSVIRGVWHQMAVHGFVYSYRGIS